jgi:hypothetical protein
MAARGGTVVGGSIPAHSGAPAQPGLATRALQACGEPTLNTFLAWVAPPGQRCGPFCRKCCARAHLMPRGCSRR